MRDASHVVCGRGQGWSHRSLRPPPPAELEPHWSWGGGGDCSETDSERVGVERHAIHVPAGPVKCKARSDLSRGGRPEPVKGAGTGQH
jgi:hypothetical protein